MGGGPVDRRVGVPLARRWVCPGMIAQFAAASKGYVALSVRTMGATFARARPHTQGQLSNSNYRIVDGAPPWEFMQRSTRLPPASARYSSLRAPSFVRGNLLRTTRRRGLQTQKRNGLTRQSAARQKSDPQHTSACNPSHPLHYRARGSRN